MMILNSSITNQVLNQHINNCSQLPTDKAINYPVLLSSLITEVNEDNCYNKSFLQDIMQIQRELL